MRTPLNVMILRRADLDAAVQLPSVTDRLKKNASPTGGSFGYVRSSGGKFHSGWDLYAKVGTPCFSILPGEVVWAASISGYGRTVVLKLHGPQAEELANRLLVPAVYALYGHLSSILVREMSVREGVAVGMTGADGNASNTPPHLHFELRTTPLPRKGVQAVSILRNFSGRSITQPAVMIMSASIRFTLS